MSDSSRRPTRVSAISFKPCWQDATGKWYSSGGFPLQMGGIASLFDEMVLVIVRASTVASIGDGGIPLPAGARVVALREPRGTDARRKLSVAARLPYYLWKLGSSMRGSDVVHTPLPGDIPLIALLLAVLMRKRTLVRYGGSWPDNAQTSIMDRVTKACMRRFAGGRNVMLATGGGNAAPAPDIAWIFSTALSRAELDLITPALDRGLSATPRLLYVGRLSSEKGVDVLLRALAMLEDDGTQRRPHLTVAGDGPERAALEALARELGCAERVSFAGQLTRSELSCELARADLCVQPSLTEGFSKAWLDAMAHGLPVLSSEVGAARSVIAGNGERGWLVPAGDANALSRALRGVLCTPIDWPSLRRRCRDYVEGLTLEEWARRIGESCARQWGWSFSNGRLLP